MDKYINADVLIEQMKKESNLMFNNYFNGFVKAIKMVNDSPTAAVQPIVHGEWYGYVCSVCGGTSEYGSENYCPHCGARMDGDTNDT